MHIRQYVCIHEVVPCTYVFLSPRSFSSSLFVCFKNSSITQSIVSPLFLPSAFAVVGSINKVIFHVDRHSLSSALTHSGLPPFFTLHPHGLFHLNNQSCLTWTTKLTPPCIPVWIRVRADVDWTHICLPVQKCYDLQVWEHAALRSLHEWQLSVVSAPYCSDGALVRWINV